MLKVVNVEWKRCFGGVVARQLLLDAFHRMSHRMASLVAQSNHSRSCAYFRKMLFLQAFYMMPLPILTLPSVYKVLKVLHSSRSLIFLKQGSG